MLRHRQGLLQQCDHGVDHHHQVQLGVVDHIRHLRRSVIWIEWHTAHTQGIHGQLVQEMLQAVFKQQAHAMPDTVTGHSVALHQVLHRVCGLRVTEGLTRWRVGPRRVGWNLQKRKLRIGLGSRKKNF